MKDGTTHNNFWGLWFSHPTAHGTLQGRSHRQLASCCQPRWSCLLGLLLFGTYTRLSIRAHIFIYVNVYVYTHIRNAILCLSTHACIYIILTVFILQEVRELMMKWKKQSAQQPSCWTSLSTNGGLFWNILVYKLYVKNNPQIINKNHFLLKHIGSLNHSPYISAE